MRFNDLLSLSEIEPSNVNIMLHSPREREFSKVLPSLIRTRPATLFAFQSSHSPGAENALKKGRKYVASFIKVGDSKLVFAGLFQNMGWRPRTLSEIWQEPEMQFINATYGVDYGRGSFDPDMILAWFDLRLAAELTEMQGRLLIGARLTPNYVRLAENLDAPVLAILEEGVFDTPPPDWRELTASAAMIRALPPGWAARLREWRGVYLIVDESDGARYVGSAYGVDNLLGRWRNHVANNKGITKELLKRDPVNFRFSILQLLAPDAEPDEVVQLEHGWMDRLHTREHGLNA